MNCTDSEGLSGGIPVLLLPEVDAGLNVRICDRMFLMSEHRMDVSLKAGEARCVTLEHHPAANLVFYDGFDRCVWGGNPMEGTGGFSPFESVGTASGGKDCTGYESADCPCGSSSAGAGYVQASFAEASPSVLQDAFMSASYVRSRGFDRYFQLLRVQEYDGCISAGVVGRSRGWVKMNPMTGIDGLSDVVVRFKICLQPGCSDVIRFTADGGGVITAARVDGKDVSAPGILIHSKTTSSFLMTAGKILDVPISLEEGMKWQQVEVTVRNASETTALSWIPETYDVCLNGFWIDDISVEKLPGSWDRGASGSLRILYWNIQNGMWADQGNNYDNFVSFVRRYSPDICIWCEGRSNCVTGGMASNPEPYLTNSVDASSGWAALAARYGHQYLGVAFRGGDNFPQVVTSRYPITRELMLGNISGAEPIAHGAGMFRIDCDGTSINLVTLHLKPYSGESYDNYRLHEITEILASTVNSANYSARVNWIMTGDFNSKSPYDREYYTVGESAYMVHRHIASNSSLVDLIHEMYPDRLVSSTTYDRIDYMYMSPELYNRVTDACTLVDSWVTPELTSADLSNFRLPSDHRPLLVQITLKHWI